MRYYVAKLTVRDDPEEATLHRFCDVERFAEPPTVKYDGLISMIPYLTKNGWTHFRYKKEPYFIIDSKHSALYDMGMVLNKYKRFYKKSKMEKYIKKL